MLRATKEDKKYRKIHDSIKPKKQA